LIAGAQKALEVGFAPAEAGANIASSAVAAPVAGLRVLPMASTKALSRAFNKAHSVPVSMRASTRVAIPFVAFRDALTYQPRTQTGQQLASAVTYPFQLLSKGADAAGGAVTDVTGSPALGSITNTAFQSVPALIAHRASDLQPPLRR
jgi:hypothetical protein